MIKMPSEQPPKRYSGHIQMGDGLARRITYPPSLGVPQGLPGGARKKYEKEVYPAKLAATTTQSWISAREWRDGS